MKDQDSITGRIGTERQSMHTTISSVPRWFCGLERHPEFLRQRSVRQREPHWPQSQASRQKPRQSGESFLGRQLRSHWPHPSGRHRVSRVTARGRRSCAVPHAGHPRRFWGCAPKPKIFRHERKASAGKEIRKTDVFRHARAPPQIAVKTEHNAYGKPCRIAAITGNRAMTFPGGIFWALGLHPQLRYVSCPLRKEQWHRIPSRGSYRRNLSSKNEGELRARNKH